MLNMVAGLICANGAGAFLKNLNLGVLGNSLTGLLGGGLGGQVINAFNGGALSTLADTPAMGTAAASGGIGGAAVMMLVSVIRKKFTT
ncbi:hypothetical protein GCM10007939_20090 [Amylibacter marinus]|uniref:DNA methyltransferase n=2 Tax=Amylibacter marinus TaxID=1475483 RepID=A0ABQ5VXD6_9RHOB|nr:hypothetical protein GCM10007939_20090 [Amylibacter marinus]